MSPDRSWMYRHIGEKRRITDEYRIGVEEFLNFAYDHPECVDDGKIRCPCKKCRCLKYQDRDEVHLCLLKFGFESNYTRWTRHGEPPIIQVEEVQRTNYLSEENVQWARDMVIEAAGPSLEQSIGTSEKPNDEANKFYKLLEDGDEPLWEGCKDYTKLSAVTRLLHLKSEYGLSNKGFEEHLKVIKGMLPGGEKLPDSYYRVNAMMKKLGLSYEIIHACKNDCVLFWGENAKLKVCPICKESRYKTNEKSSTKKSKPLPWKVLRYFPITPRLQRLYMSSKTADHMRWHSDKRKDVDGEMRHPADCEAWKDFDRKYPEFAEEVRNVRLGLATDGFNPFGHSSTVHSTWPVFVVPYNLPPWMCMKQSYIFMSLLISGPKSPGRDIDVYLRPLIEELKVLWSDGVVTYDASLKTNFIMKAAILWTISDFPAYGMLSGWSTHGKLSCPYCMDNEVAFRLANGKKPCYFGCHRRWLKRNHRWRKDKEKFNNKMETKMAPPQRSGEYVLNVVSGFEQIKFGKWKGCDDEKFPGFGVWHNWTKKSIFFDLPYWSKLLIRHNLDVMHIEKNVFDNVFYTVMNVKGKSKDHINARKDLCALGIRHELHAEELSNKKHNLPKATYTLSNEQIKQVYEWLKMLKVPDGYASNISRCVNLAENKINGLKSHDCHVLMERFLPLAFRDFLPKFVWEPLTALSHFFRDICSKVYKEEELEKLEKGIIDTLCQLEMIFPPSFFDSMEHLPIHLAYEAKMGGPVQYRWMYPFERYMCHLKKKVRNRTYPEGSIAEAYRIEELVTFCSRYFDLKVDTKLTRPGRNDDKCESNNNGRISIFCLPGRAIGRGEYRYLSDEEYNIAALYVLTSYDENGHFMSKHKAELRRDNPDISFKELDELHDMKYSSMVRGRGGGFVGSRGASTSVRPRDDSSQSVHAIVDEEIPNYDNVVVLSRRRERAPPPNPRGFTRGAEPPLNPDERPFTPLGDVSFLEPEARSRIGFLVKSHLPGPCADWDEWSEDEKEVVWQKFLEYYQFKEEDLKRAQKLLDMHVAGNYRNWMYREREAAKRRHGGDLKKSANDPPKWIGKSKWQGLLKKWISKEWADKSIVGKRNRSMCGRAVYTGGCRPVEQVALDMYKQTGHMPSHLEVFKETHQTKIGKSKEWISTEARRIGEEYQTLLEEKRTSDGLLDYDDPDFSVWKTVVGVKKGRLLGLGSRQKFNSSKFDASTSSSYLGMSRNDPIVKQLQDEVNKLQDEVKDLREKASQFDTLQANFAMLCEHIGVSLPFQAPINKPAATDATTDAEVYIPSFEQLDRNNIGDDMGGALVNYDIDFN